jgi:hypothetical protein
MNPSVDPSTPSATLPSRLETFSSTHCLGNVSKVNSSNPSQLSTDNTTLLWIRHIGSLSLLRLKTRTTNKA